MLRRALFAALRTGAVPEHVAFIMDGNRRWARARGKKVAAGHAQGFESLKRVLDWLLAVGVSHVSAYAFSVDNFKRPKKEVDALMYMAKERFQELLAEGEVISRYDMRVRIIGELDLLPDDVRKAMLAVEDATADNHGPVLNVCFAYTSRHELARVASDVARGVRDGEIDSSDVTPALLDRCLYTSRSPAVDMLVRTSGETRLSDFFLWQNRFCKVVIMDDLWPDVSFWDVVGLVLSYQLSCAAQQKLRAAADKASCLQKASSTSERVDAFVEALFARRAAAWRADDDDALPCVGSDAIAAV